MYTYRELAEWQSGLAMLVPNFSEGALAEMWFEQLGSHNNFAADIRAWTPLCEHCSACSSTECSGPVHLQHVFT